MNILKNKIFHTPLLTAIYAVILVMLSSCVSREPFAKPSDVAVIVAGTGAGGVIVFQTPCGSTANVEDVEVTRPYMHKVIRGATLTKYGR
jgi:CBS-domain-containing membrane protein